MSKRRPSFAFEDALVAAGPGGANPGRTCAPLDPPHGSSLFTAVVCGLAGWGLIAAIPVDGSNIPAGLLLLASAATLYLVVRLVPWSQLPPWVQTLPILAIFPLLAVLNELDGTTTSMFSPIIVIPAGWFAFFGSRRQVLMAAVATAITYMIPAGPELAAGLAWRRGLMLAVAIAVLGLVANRAVESARASRRRTIELTPNLEQLDAILRGATEHAIIGTDLFGMVTSYNVGAERMLGWKADEVIGRMRAQDFHDPDELRAKAASLGLDDPGLAIVHGVLNGTSGSDEWVLHTKDGHRLQVHLGVTAMRDDEGQLTGFIGIASDLTSQRRIEDRYAKLVESLPDTLIYVLDTDLVVTSTTGRMLEGVAANVKLIGHHIGAVTGMCDPPVVPAFERARGGNHQVFDCRTTDGRFFRGEIVPMIGPDGEVEELVCTLRDVTEERAALRSLTASEEHHRHIVSSLREGVAYFDTGGRVLEANDAAKALLGLSENYVFDPALVTALAIEHPDGTPWPMSESPLSVALATGEAQIDQSLKLCRRNGTKRWLNINAVPVFGTDGVEGAVVSLSDETERREAEQAVALSRDHFSALIEHSHDMILVLDEDTKATYLSPAWKQVLGWDDLAAQFAADPIALVHPEDVRALTRAYLGVGEQPGAVDTVRYRFRHRDGSWRTLEATLTNLRHDPAVGGTVTNARDITPQVEAAMKLTHHALHDTLTGLPNRDLVQDRIQRALDRQRRDGGYVAVLFLDLDRFKTVNDSLGHAVGDALLVEVAQRLDRSLRPGDTVGRLGGDEFIVIAEQFREPDDAITLARRLSESLNEPLDLAGQHLMARASIGVVTTDGLDEPSPGDLLRDADAAMYKAKQSGRGRWEVFDDGLRRAAIDRLVTEQELRTGLSRREFLPYFQPQYDLMTGRLIGAEALVRWQHPSRGILPPAAFLEVADSTGLLTALGWQVFEQAFEQAHLWRLDVPDFVMSVNLSIGQLSEPDFAARLEVLLERAEVDPSAICLELTEYSLLELKGVAARELSRAKTLGVSVAVDDFGTGYSNLQLLANVRVDVLKIDRSFVDPLDQHDAERHHAVASAIVSLGHTLGLTVVAEGVERVEHVDALLALGCDEAQGYLFGRPVEPAAFVIGSCPLLARPTERPTPV